MKLGILGSGLMGTALGLAWAQAGHQIIFSYSRDPGKLQQLAQQAGNGSQATSVKEAGAQSDAVLVAVPWHRLDEVLDQAGSLRSKTLLTCMLPMTDDDSDLALGLNTSGAEVLAQRTGAHVVSTFNTVWSDVITVRQSDNTPRSMLYVGDDSEAKAVASGLIHDAGFEPLDAGELRNARLLELFGLLMGRLGFAYNPQIAYRIIQSADWR
jgi:8-hydroxy-5-deazaflavin:NADPH oxidoreductase